MKASRIVRETLRSVFLTVTLWPLIWDSAAAQAPIKIGASLSLTGSYSALGQNQHRA
jgi:ABC-type branched-subunit amino acid transport system substrate-binding protein